MANYFLFKFANYFSLRRNKKTPNKSQKNPISVVIAYRDSGQGPEGHTTVARLE